MPNNRDLGATSGGALGAGLGAIVGNQIGEGAAGLAIGAVAGTLVGGVVGNQYDEIEKMSSKQDLELREQNAQLERQRREIEELRRQRYYDASAESFNRGASSGEYSGNANGATGFSNPDSSGYADDQVTIEPSFSTPNDNFDSRY